MKNRPLRIAFKTALCFSIFMAAALIYTYVMTKTVITELLTVTLISAVIAVILFITVKSINKK